MEYVDALTEAGQNTGNKIVRSLAHAKGIWHRTVHVWIRNRSGELLLQRRSLNKETFPGLWDISAAGHISAGDSSKEAAIREMLEEVGVSCDSESLRFLFTLRQSYKSPDGSIEDNEIIDVYLCTKPVEEDELTLDPKEVMGAAFYSIPKIKKLISEKSVLLVPHDEEYARLFEAFAALA
jgi:isopentenyl-diphosphate Delta-isomerase